MDVIGTSAFCPSPLQYVDDTCSGDTCNPPGAAGVGVLPASPNATPFPIDTEATRDAGGEGGDASGDVGGSGLVPTGGVGEDKNDAERPGAPSGEALD